MTKLQHIKYITDQIIMITVAYYSKQSKARYDLICIQLHKLFAYQL